MAISGGQSLTATKILEAVKVCPRLAVMPIRRQTLAATKIQRCGYHKKPECADTFGNGRSGLGRKCNCRWIVIRVGRRTKGLSVFDLMGTNLVEELLDQWYGFTMPLTKFGQMTAICTFCGARLRLRRDLASGFIPATAPRNLNFDCVSCSVEIGIHDCSGPFSPLPCAAINSSWQHAVQRRLDAAGHNLNSLAIRFQAMCEVDISPKQSLGEAIAKFCRDCPKNPSEAYDERPSYRVPVMGQRRGGFGYSGTQRPQCRFLSRSKRAQERLAPLACSPRQHELISSSCQQVEYGDLIAPTRPLLDQSFQRFAFDGYIRALAIRFRQIGEHAIQGTHAFVSKFTNRISGGIASEDWGSGKEGRCAMRNALRHR